MPSPMIPSGHRSVSDSVANYPFDAQSINSTTSHSRSSTNLSNSGGGGAKAGPSTGHLPSIRSLRSRFQAFGNSSKKAAARQGPKVVVEAGTSEGGGGSAPMGYSHSAGSHSSSQRKPSPQAYTPEVSPPTQPGPTKLRRPSHDSALPRRIPGYPSPPPLSTSSPSSPSLIPKSRIPTSTTTSPSSSPSQRPLARLNSSTTSRDHHGEIPTSPGTKALYRISSDFERPSNLPPLSQLRQGNKLIRRKSSGSTRERSSEKEEALPTLARPVLSISTDSSSTSTDSIPKAPPSASTSTATVPTPRAFVPIVIPPPSSTSSSRSTRSSIDSNSTRGMSGTLFSSSLEVQQRVSPPPAPQPLLLDPSSSTTEKKSDDLAFRRHSIASLPSPLLSPGGNSSSSPDNARRFSSSHPSFDRRLSSRAETLKGPSPSEPGISGLGIGSDSLVIAFLDGQNNDQDQAGFPTVATTPPATEGSSLARALAAGPKRSSTTTGDWREPPLADFTSPKFDSSVTRPLAPSSGRPRPRSATYDSARSSPDLSRSKHVSSGSAVGIIPTSLPPPLSPLTTDLSPIDSPSTSFASPIQHQHHHHQPPLVHHSRIHARHSTGDSSFSLASSTTTAAVVALRSQSSRHSGNTFGEMSPSLNGGSGGGGSSSDGGGGDHTRHSSFLPDDVEVDIDIDQPLSQQIGTASSTLRRSRSAVESVRAAGGSEVQGMGTVSKSPVYVLSAEDFGGELYSGSARRAAEVVPPSERGSMLGEGGGSGGGKRKSERSLGGKASRETVESTKLSPTLELERDLERLDQDDHDLDADQEDRDEASESEEEERDRLHQLASPLDSLIAGLGGRPESHISVDTSTSQNRLSRASGLSDDPFEGDQPMSPPLPTSPHFAPLLPASFESPTTPFQSLHPEPPTIEFSPSSISSPPLHSTLVSNTLPPPEEPDDDAEEAPLTIPEMEREIARMEAELALSGSTSIAPSPNRRPSSVSSSPLLDKSTLTFPTPPSRRVSLARTHSQTSSSNGNSPARRWSIVEVELAYHRMKQMLGSSKSRATSDAGTLAGESEIGDGGDVEGAFERALMNVSRGPPEDDDEVEEVLPVVQQSHLPPIPPRSPHRNATLDRFPPLPTSPLDPDSTPKLVQQSPLGAFHNNLPSSPISSPPSTHSLSPSALFSAPSHKTSRESLLLVLPFKKPPTPSSASRRRHTLTTPPSQSDLADVFLQGENEARVGREELERRSERNFRRGSLQPLRVGTPTEGVEDGRKSPASRVGLRSGAGRDWARDHPGGGGGAVSPGAYSIDENGRPSSRSTDEERPPTPTTKRLLLNGGSRRWDAQSTSTSIDEGDATTRRKKVEPNSDTWYPNTPDRAGLRGRLAGKIGGKDKDALPSSALGQGVVAGGDYSLSMAQIRGMDKLEIFFKYAAMKAELEKTQLERDALLDALRESRATLTDVRGQRDDLDADLRRERSASRQLKKHLGADAESSADALDDLVRARQLWEKRAREALEDMERAREDSEDLRMVVVEGREREERLERELALLGARFAVAEADLRSTHALSPTEQRSSNIIHSSPTNSRGRYNSTDSPTRSSFEREQQLTPARKLAAEYRERGASSSASSLLQGAVESNSPLMGQTLSFGPKSSYGSNISPFKLPTTTAPTTTTTTTGDSRSKSPTKPLLLGTISRNVARRASKDSIASSDYGEHLPPPVERPWDPNGSAMTSSTMPELNERDEAFLSDLSGPIEAA